MTRLPLCILLKTTGIETVCLLIYWEKKKGGGGGGGKNKTKKRKNYFLLKMARHRDSLPIDLLGEKKRGGGSRENKCPVRKHILLYAYGQVYVTYKYHSI